MMNKPEVSIVMPAYNSAEFLEEAINSVINQSFSNWELIIIDDCSSDRSRDIILAYQNKEPRIISIFNTNNSGSGVSRNKGIELATGEWIAFLDSDDIWQRNKLENQIAFANERNAVFCHCGFELIDEAGMALGKKAVISDGPVDYTSLLKFTEIGCLTAMYNQDKIGKHFMSEHRRKQDYALWLSILKQGYISYGLNEQLALYRLRKGSATSNKSKLVFRHIKFLMDTQSMGFFRATYYTFHWAKNGVRKFYA